MPDVARTSFYDIVAVVRTRLTTVLEMQDRVVRIARRKYIPKDFADRDIVLIGGSAQSDDGRFTGGGRSDQQVVRTLSALVRIKRSLDPIDGDRRLLQDIWALEDSVLNALLEFHPEDASRNLLTVDPLRLATVAETMTESMQSPDWASEILTFEVRYQPAITIALP